MTEVNEIERYFNSMHTAISILYERHLANMSSEQVDWETVRKNIKAGTDAFCTAIGSLPDTKKEPDTTMSSHEFLTLIYSKATDLSIAMYMLDHPLEGNWDTSTLTVIGKLFHTCHRDQKFEQYLLSMKNPKLTHNERFTIVHEVVDSSHSSHNKLTPEDWATINASITSYFKQVNKLQLDQHKVLDNIMEYERENSSNE